VNIFFVSLKLYMRTLPMFISNFNFIIGKTRCVAFIRRNQLNGFPVR